MSQIRKSAPKGAGAQTLGELGTERFLSALRDGLSGMKQEDLRAAITYLAEKKDPTIMALGTALQAGLAPETLKPFKVPRAKTHSAYVGSGLKIDRETISVADFNDAAKNPKAVPVTGTDVKIGRETFRLTVDGSHGGGHYDELYLNSDRTKGSTELMRLEDGTTAKETRAFLLGKSL